MNVMANLVNFGWRHIELLVPKEWNLASEKGSMRKGYFRLEEDIPRLELLWEKIPFEKAPDHEKILNEYLRSVEKKNKEKKLIQVGREEIKINGHPAILYRGRINNMLITISAWYCEKSEKAFLSVIYFKPSDDIKQLTKDIQRSIRCHFPDGYKILWSTYAVSLRLPKNYYLVDGKFSALFSYVIFKEVKKEIYIVLGYSGVPKHILKKVGGLKEWYEKFIIKKTLKKILKLGKVIYEEKENIITIKAKTSSLIPFQSKILRGYLWLDEMRERIFSLSSVSPKKLEEESQIILKDLLQQMIGAKEGYGADLAIK